jgi:hypothetical protein
MKTSRLILAVASLAAAALFIPVRLVAQSAANTVSLAGQWRFQMDRDDVGVAAQWFNKDLTDQIKLPGILQGQGYGDDISVDTPWVATPRLSSQWWTQQPESVRAKYSQPGKVEVPFLSQPAKHYLGVAWYQRDIVIPPSWAGKRVELYLERPHWQTTAYVDDKQYGYNDSLVAPHVTDLGVLTPGKHRLSIRIDNRTMLPNDGQHLLDGHAVSDSLGAPWNGIAGRIELHATTPVWIDDAQVFPEVDKKLAHVKIKIGNDSGQGGTGEVRAIWDGQQTDVGGVRLNGGGSVDYTSANVTWDANGGTAELDVPLSSSATAWDEYHPVLQHLSLSLKGGAADDKRTVAFGLRQITAADKDMLLNGQIINLRTTHDGGEFPLTGYPSMDVDSWKKIIQTCKDFGLNGMRFHSWCPPEAAFQAADELGFYLQPECGMWNALDPNSPMAQRLEEETARMEKAYGNHPSYLLLSPSNEPKGNYGQTTPKWAAQWYQKDNRRLYSAGTGWSNAFQVTGGAQYASMAAYGAGQLRGDRGWFGSDFRAALQNVHIPVLSHEVGQWCAYPDFEVMKKFTGFLRPGNYDIFRDIADQHGLLGWNKLFAWASGRYQLECYKEDIEANLRTPGLAGFQILDLHDYLGQGTALIGVLDAFWQSKGYVDAAEYRRFAGPIVPLARLAKRTFTTGDRLDTDVELYNFGNGPIVKGTPYWQIVDAQGRVVATGEWPTADLPVGKNIPLGHVSAELSQLPAPAAYKLVVGVRNNQGLTVKNDWNLWLYPAQADVTAPEGVTITHSWADARAALAAGGKVLFMPTAADLTPNLNPPMQRVPVFWNRQMNPKFDAMLGLVCDTASPALAKFPTNINCDWQWTEIVIQVPAINLNGVTHDLRPIVWAIDDWNRNWRLGVVFECNVGTGRLLVSAIDLQNGRGGPVLAQLRRSLYDYVGSDKFAPSLTLAPEDADKLWVSTSPAPVAPAAGGSAAPALDVNNPNSDVYEGPRPTAQ